MTIVPGRIRAQSGPRCYIEVGETHPTPTASEPITWVREYDVERDRLGCVWPGICFAKFGVLEDASLTPEQETAILGAARACRNVEPQRPCWWPLPDTDLIPPHDATTDPTQGGDNA